MGICCFLIQYSTDNYGDKSLGWLPKDFPVGFKFDLKLSCFLILRDFASIQISMAIATRHFSPVNL